MSLVSFLDNIHIQLRSVNFSNVQIPVFAPFDESTACGDYIYTEVERYANFTYEHGHIAFSGKVAESFIFLNHFHMHTVRIVNVTLTGLECTGCSFANANSWLYFELRDCLFADNHLQAGFFLVVNPTEWLLPTYVRPVDVTPYMHRVNYIVSNCVFRHNSFATGSHFSFTFSGLMQNIHLSSLHFYSESSTLVVVVSTLPINKQRIKGSVYVPANTKLRIAFPPATVTLHTLEIVNCTSPRLGHIYLYQIPYVRVMWR